MIVIVVVVVSNAVAGHSEGIKDVLMAEVEIDVVVVSWRLPNAKSPRRSPAFASAFEASAQARTAMERKRLCETFIVGEGGREGSGWTTGTGDEMKETRENGGQVRRAHNLYL